MAVIIKKPRPPEQEDKEEERSLPPSVIKAKELQEKKDIETGRATSVKIEHGKVVSARSSSGGYVSPDVALAQSPEEKAQIETKALQQKQEKERIQQSLLKRQEILKEQKASEQASEQARMQSQRYIQQSKRVSYQDQAEARERLSKKEIQQTRTSFAEGPKIDIVKKPTATIETAQPFFGKQQTKGSEVILSTKTEGVGDYLGNIPKYGSELFKEGDKVAGGLFIVGGTAATMLYGFGKGIITKPVESIIDIPKSIIELPSQVKGATPIERTLSVAGIGAGIYITGKVLEPIPAVIKKVREASFNRYVKDWQKSLSSGKAWKGEAVYEPRTSDPWAKESKALVPSEKGIPKKTSKIIEVEARQRGLPIVEESGAIVKGRQLQVIPKEVGILAKDKIPFAEKPSSGTDPVRIIKSGKKPAIIETQVQQKIAGEPFILKTDKGVKIIEKGLTPEIPKEPSPSFAKLTETGKKVSSVIPDKQTSLKGIKTIAEKRKIGGLLEDRTIKPGRYNVGDILGVDMYIPLEVTKGDRFSLFDEARATPTIIKPIKASVDIASANIRMVGEPVSISPSLLAFSTKKDIIVTPTIKTDQVQSIKEKSVIKTDTKIKTDIKARQDIIHIVDVKVGQVVESIPKQAIREKQKQDIIAIPKQILIEETTTPTIKKPIKITTKPKSTDPFIPPVVITREKKFKQRRKLFATKVRRRGKFDIIGKFASKEKAFMAGKRNLLGTAAASFKVEQEGRPVLFKPFDRRFYTSKREKGVIIQKREFRISSSGEKKEITKKGLATIRLKKINLRG